MGALGSINTNDFQSGGPGGSSSGLLPPVVGDKGHGPGPGGKRAPGGGKGKAQGEKGKGSGNQEGSLSGVLDTVTRRLNEQVKEGEYTYTYTHHICPHTFTTLSP